MLEKKYVARVSQDYVANGEFSAADIESDQVSYNTNCNSTALAHVKYVASVSQFYAVGVSKI